MNSSEFEELAITAYTFKVKPSSYIADISGLEAYYFDVACAYYINYIKNGKKKLDDEENDATNWL